jgi:HlyD family secretion protein
MDSETRPATTSATEPSRVTFDQLDTMVRVTTVQGWVYLGLLFAIGVGSIVFAVLFEVPTKVNGEGILLTERDMLVRVRARATGRLLVLHARLGDQVAANALIGEIAQEDLEDRIHQDEVRLADLRREDDELTRFEEAERESKEAAVLQVREAVLAARQDSLDKLKIAGRVVEGANRLRADRYLGDLELLESREKLYDVRDDLNKGRTRLAELGLDRVTAENLRKRARLERRHRIAELTTKVNLDREKLQRTSRVVSPVQGQVAQVLSVPGGLIQEGAPVVLLHAPKAQRGADDLGDPYDVIVFVMAGEGKKIEVGNSVEVVPATVKREEHGFIRGCVVAISELPATRQAMEAALEHPELVDAFLKRYAPGVVLRVQIKLEEAKVTGKGGRVPGAAKRKNPFLWSSSSGPAQPLKTGTICQAAIIVEHRPLIRLILPWTKKLVGADEM